MRRRNRSRHIKRRFSWGSEAHRSTINSRSCRKKRAMWKTPGAILQSARNSEMKAISVPGRRRSNQAAVWAGCFLTLNAFVLVAEDRLSTAKKAFADGDYAGVVRMLEA